MRRIFLCGQTGNINRGCEAIVRSTVKLLCGKAREIYVASFAPWSDRPMARELGINLISYASYPSQIYRYVSAIKRKLNKHSIAGQSIIQAPLFERMTRNDLCLNIGGDIYCYAEPVPSIALNKFTSKNGIDNILWCCSIEKDKITKEIIADLKKYKYIFAREPLTYDNLKSSGIDNEKIIRCCDPAFFLDTKETELPQGFINGNTVGINVSELTINDSNPYAYQNVIATIKYILEKTDMGVCLIPHVYSIKENRNDYPIIKKIYDEISNERVSIVDKEYDCEQLKHIISNCRFFIGARTHATIAAYSTGVPTLVIGYSVKSKGIAIDLFGKYEGYVIPYNELTEKLELVATFENIINKEKEIRERLALFLPEYKKTLTNAIDNCIKNEGAIQKPFEICTSDICTGCSACATNCPQSCITMTEDKEGFLYPTIDFDKCISCGLCRKICPAMNKFKDTGKKPDTYASIIKDQNVRKNSSSGGIFSALAISVIQGGGAVFGAGFDEGLKVVHKKCESIEELVQLRGSKYVQSEIGTCYKEAKDILDSGREVLFVGTGCQIGGLHAYLGKQYDNLLSVDFICHGTPSPKVWRKYVESKEKKAKSKAINGEFRYKKVGWKPSYLKIEFENSTKYESSVLDDDYLRGLASDLYLRPSCELCSFKQVHRQSDVTLGSFCGIERADSKFNDNREVSLVMVHSEKGRDALRKIESSICLEEQDFDFAITDNPSYYKPITHSVFRPLFFKKIDKTNIEGNIKKYCGKSFIGRVKRKLLKMFLR